MIRYSGLIGVLMIFSVLFFKCTSDHTVSMRFRLLPSEKTGITFRNGLEETHEMNIISYPDFYSGGGVSIGDIDNDGLPDVFFTGNQVSPRLYKNLGNMTFQDITVEAGLSKKGIGWHTGTCMVDINADGYLDIYVSKSGMEAPEDRANMLYINNGNGTFTERAKEYGLDNQGYGVNAAFFDYDKDGDVDVYVANQVSSRLNSNDAARLRNIPHPYAGDRLYENVDGHFVDVSQKAGIYSSEVGFAHGIAIGDINNDGWEDMYVSNDFFEYDYLYLNNGDKTFREVMKDQMRHIPNFSMGNDLADFNNDGQLDLAVLDMVAEDNRRLYMNTGGMGQQRFERGVQQGLYYQYMFNMLQMNNGNGTFSDVGMMAGMARTDWSWAPLLADYDNDGFKDLYVTNGLRKDIRNIDWGFNYRNLTQFVSDFSKFEKSQWDMLLGTMPSEQVVNYMMRNNGDLTFTKVMEDWGMDQKSWSNGAAYGDLDNDGDLDIVVNNIDGDTFVYENESKGHNYIRFSIRGPAANPMGLGTKIKICHGGKFQYQQHYVSRGYRSSMEPGIHFGIGLDSLVDKAEITWPDGKTTVLIDLKANAEVRLDYATATSDSISAPEQVTPVFEDVTSWIGIEMKHRENEVYDFMSEPMLPYKMSTLGPAFACADVNNDGLDDIFMGGSYHVPAQLFLQQPEGCFTLQTSDLWESEKNYEDVGAAFLDYDLDGDLDLYVASGGNENTVKSHMMDHRLYANDGHGIFTKPQGVIPEINVSGAVVRPCDVEGDGDWDLFVGGRMVPGNYGMSPDSYLLINDHGKFIDATEQSAHQFKGLGMVIDAVWSDYDRDGDRDLIVVGEWMPITVFYNDHGKLKLLRNSDTGLEKSNGWWMSIAAVDMDNDGDDDYILGNMGLNYKFKASPNEPFELFVGDFDESGDMDVIMGYHQEGKIYPGADRNKILEQNPSLARTIVSHDQFATMTLEDIYGKELLKKSINKKIHTMASGYLENRGNDQFTFSPFDNYAQISCTRAISTFDADGDGNNDILLAGNLYGMEAETIRMDGGIGAFLRGNGNGKFQFVPLSQSGLYVDGDVRHVIQMILDDRKMWLFARNNEPVVAVGLSKK